MRLKSLILLHLGLAQALLAGVQPKTTVTPVTQDRDRAAYSWIDRHTAILELNKARRPKVVLIGDSITHFWGGAPRMGKIRGAASWARYLEPRDAANLGFGWDMTENVLWRLQHGEVDGLRPRAVILLIGTNNLQADSVPDILLGVDAIVAELRHRCPSAKVLVLALPRGSKADPLRVKSVELAAALVAKQPGDKVLDLSSQFIQADGSIPRELMSDLLHPTEKGYEIMGTAVDRQLTAWGI